jgi:hypothetical protein
MSIFDNKLIKKKLPPIINLIIKIYWSEILIFLIKYNEFNDKLNEFQYLYINWVLILNIINTIFSI